MAQDNNHSQKDETEKGPDSGLENKPDGVKTESQSKSPQAQKKESPATVKAEKEALPKEKAGSKKAATGGSGKTKTKAQKTSSRKSGLTSLFVILFLGVLGAAGYFLWVEWQARITESVTFQDGITNLESDLRASSNQQAERARQQDQRIDELETQLRETQLRVNSQAKRIMELGNASRSEWLLAEAEYLIRLASQRLQTERSTKNPLALLQSADAILLELDDPELLPVRKVLAEDITALRMAGLVDREGLYLELQSLTHTIAQLSILREVDSDGEQVQLLTVDQSQQPETETTDWRDETVSSFKRFAHGLTELIVVRKRDNPVEALLPAAEEAIVRQNLQLMLEQAQMSLLLEEQAIYNSSLENSGIWLRDYFQFNQHAEVLAERLEVLREQSIVQQLPDVSGSLNALSTLIELRHKRAVVEEAAVEKDDVTVEETVPEAQHQEQLVEPTL